MRIKAKATLSPAEQRRYHRQIILSEVGHEGQETLKAAKVMIIGLGGLGAPTATYLASAGIGCLTFVDYDKVDVTNLHRQVLFTVNDVGRLKTEVTLERIQALNPDIKSQIKNTKIHPGNIYDIIADNDIVVDCTDNFKTRYAINDGCLARRIPCVQASILQFEAQLSIFCSVQGPCYRCIYPDPPPAHIAPSCADAGVIGVLPGILGILQANEVLKLILGIGTPLINKLLSVDALENGYDLFEISRNENCQYCSGGGDVLRSIMNGFAADERSKDQVLSASELLQLIKSEQPIQIVDVRSPQERIEQGVIANDISLPLPLLPNNIDVLEPHLPVICYCLSGQRSAQAANILLSKGFSDIRILKGGILAWDDVVK